jgi:spermidine/putrescine transport system substrate-binding protein
MLKKLSKILAVMLVLSVTMLNLSGFASARAEKKVLNLFTWANYVPDDVVKKFQKETGIKVNYSNFSTNEEMMAKLQAVKGSQYDVVICSDYIIQLMAAQKNALLKQLDKSKIKNLKNIDSAYMKQYYDKTNKYSLPYTLGAEMLVYNAEAIKKPLKSIKDLWDPSLKDSVVLLDDPRSVIGLALTKLGYSINETDSKKLDQAKEELKKLKPNVKVLDADTPHNSLISGDTTAGIMWGSQASAAVKGNSKLKIAYPIEGMQVGEDNFVIPVNAPHADNAYAFIDFMLRGDVSNMATETIEYINTTTAAKKYMSKAYLNNKAVFVPSSEFKKAKFLKDVGAATKIYDQIWSEFKQQ